MLQEERIQQIITERSNEIDARKRPWLDLARTNEHNRREDTAAELKGDYQRTIEQTEDKIMELDNFYLEIQSHMNLA